MSLTIETLVEGDNQTFPRPGDTVHIHYTGTLSDGRVFDSSHKRGRPFVVKIGTGLVITGWDEGVPKMSLGETALLTAGPEFAYGAMGVPPLIPPNATLKFEMELLKIDRERPEK
ncbi:peptidyl-prolyl cis-trans isomerase [Hymenopellis radicata]|nr:peptidyl-prolyl cis-trans isomerase [Hymenopellis radicata]